MNLATLLLLGLTVAPSQPAADYYPLASRGLKLDIDYKPERRNDIQQVQLLVSRDEGQTWSVSSVVTPDKDHFAFTAEQDGPYWLNMVIVYRNGTKEPPDVTRVPPAQKLLIDTKQPTVALTKLDWDNGDIVAEWSIDDAYPNDAITEVAYRTVGPIDAGWTPVASTNIVRRSARFRPSTDGGIVVRITAKDLAGNAGTVVRELAVTRRVEAAMPATNPATGLNVPPPNLTGMSVPPTTGPVTGTSEPDLLPGVGTGVSVNPNGPISVPPALVASRPPSVAPPVATQPMTTQPIATQPVATAPVSTVPLPAPTVTPERTPAPTPAPAWTPPAPAQPAYTPSQPPSAAPVTGGPTPIAVANGTAPAPAANPNAKVINFARFDLQYQVDNGPSGISRVELYVTRDGGRTWGKWSDHDGRETPLKVVLDTRMNPQVEGDYGFRMVAVSGAGLSDGPPLPGAPAEFSAHVDLTPPIVKVYAPTADPNRRNALRLHWEATDRNFGRDPIAIEWSEQPTGPWQPVSTASGLVPVAGAGTGAGAAPVGRLPNTGSYSWALPPTLATHQVYLKFTAWDMGGNRSEVVTPSPVLVDLTKPVAHIQGIISSGNR